MATGAQRSNIVGLANTIVFHTFNLTYVRQINDNMVVTGQVGLVGVSNDFSLGLPKTLLPIYSIEGSWSITPKLRLDASASRVVTPPTTVIANAEVAYNAILSLTYQLTPKVCPHGFRNGRLYERGFHARAGLHDLRGLRGQIPTIIRPMPA